jgi:hypothetical protein
MTCVTTFSIISAVGGVHPEISAAPIIKSVTAANNSFRVFVFIVPIPP